MIGLKNFVQLVNDCLKTLLDSHIDFAGYKLFGIGTNAIRNGTQNQTYPAIFDKTGEGVYLGVDDIYSVTVYHKVNRMTSFITGKGYGDSRGEVRNVYQMSMIIFLNRFRAQIDADELVLLVQSVFPESENFPNFTSVLYTINDIILNTQQVFNGEYRNVDYFVKPEHALVAINYTIESTFKPNCFNFILKETPLNLQNET